jgi:hypothetical protein
VNELRTRIYPATAAEASRRASNVGMPSLPDTAAFRAEFLDRFQQLRMAGFQLRPLFRLDSTPSRAISELARRHVPDHRPYLFAQWLRMNYQSPRAQYFGNRGARTSSQLWNELIEIDRELYRRENTLTADQVPDLVKLPGSDLSTKTVESLASKYGVSPETIRQALV